MTRSVRFAVALVGLLVVVGCAASKPPAASRSPSGDIRLRMLAAILRAEDRREVDAALRAALSDPDSEVRAHAARALGRIAALESRTLLETAAADPDPTVRAEVAQGLGLVGDPASVPVLVRLATDPVASVRTDAAVALGRTHDASSVDAIRNLFSDADAGVVAATCLAAWRYENPDFAVAPLIGLTRVSSAEVRFAAAYALGRLGSAGAESPPSAVPAGRLSDQLHQRVREHLHALGRSKEPEVRIQAARGLTAPTTDSEKRLLETLASDPDPRVRIQALRSLAQPGASAIVLQGALTSKDVPVVQAALVALGQIGGPVALEALIRQIIYGKDPWLKETAITAIGRVDPDRAAAIAAGLSKESEPLLRAAAVRNLTGRTDPASEEILARVLDDPDVRVQVAAVLARAGADGPLDRLLGKTPKSPDPAVREAVANIAGLRLARSGSTEEERSEAFAVLDRVWESSANDALPIARAEVLEAATRAGKDPRVHAVLVRGLGDRDRQVRLRAIETLRSLYEEDHRERAGPAANRPVEDYVEILRWASRPRAAIVTMARGGFAPGRFTVRLDQREAPLASWNFAQLASRGFYDGLFVHRVVPGFVVQDGDPRGDGNGDAGYAIRDEIGRHPFRTGTVGMASSGRDTAGSQWFVLLSPQPHLDGRYTAFGEVVQNLVGVAAQILPGDRVTSIRVYEGDGTERLPPL